MLIINRTKKLKKYEMPKMPDFEYKILKYAWLRYQKREAELINIRSIDIQVKDIKQMIYAKSFRMVSLHAKCLRNMYNTKINDEDYITLVKAKKGSKKESVNKELIYDIITADWIINSEEIEDKSIEELENELQNIESRIQRLNLKLTKGAFSKSDIANRINLLTYKYDCIYDYLRKKQENIKLKKMTKK